MGTWSISPTTGGASINSNGQAKIIIINRLLLNGGIMLNLVLAEALSILITVIVDIRLQPHRQ